MFQLNIKKNKQKKKWQEEFEKEKDLDQKDFEAIADQIENTEDVLLSNIKNDQEVNPNTITNENSGQVINKNDKLFDWMSDSYNSDKDSKSESKSELEPEAENISLSYKNKDKQNEMIVTINEEKNDDSLVDNENNIFVSNLPVNAKDIEIIGYFANFGEISNVDIPKNEGTDFNKGKAFIDYKVYADAIKAYESTNKKEFKGKILNVELGIMPSKHIKVSDKVFIQEEKRKSRSRSRSRSRSNDRKNKKKHHKHPSDNQGKYKSSYKKPSTRSKLIYK